MIKMLKEKGYRVQTNIDDLPRDHRGGARGAGQVCSTRLGVDGMLLTPGYHYQVLTNDDIYLKQG